MSKARRDFTQQDVYVPLAGQLLRLVDYCQNIGQRFGQVVSNMYPDSSSLYLVSNEQLTSDIRKYMTTYSPSADEYAYTNYGLLGTWYDLRSALPLALGQALLYQANHNMGFDPYYGGPDCTDPDKAFREDLIKHGTALINWCEEDDDDKNNLMNAIAALHWFANNLEEMWD